MAAGAGRRSRGRLVDSTSILLRYTLLVDANTDGKADLTDFAITAGNFNRSGKTFAGGNFDYDPLGTVALAEFALLAANFNPELPRTAASHTAPAAARPDAPSTHQALWISRGHGLWSQSAVLE